MTCGNSYKTYSRQFQYTDDKSDKFWNITLYDTTLTVQFGRNGTSGQTQTKDLGSCLDAANEYRKLVREKLKKGYVEVEPKRYPTQHPETAALAAELEDIIIHLSPYLSESEYPFEVFVWDTSEQGELSVDKLLEQGGFLRRMTPNEGLAMYHMSEERQAILPNVTCLWEWLLSELTDTEFYVWMDPLDPYEHYEDMGGIAIVGRTPEGDWLSIAPDPADSYRESYERGRNPTNTQRLPVSVSAPQYPGTIPFQQRLQQTLQTFNVAGFFYPDAKPPQIYKVTSSDSRSAALSHLMDAIDYTATYPFVPYGEEYSAESEHDNEDEEDYFIAIAPLNRFLQTRLSNLQEYRIGYEQCVYHLYSLGRLSNGDWLGVSTITICSG